MSLRILILNLVLFALIIVISGIFGWQMLGLLASAEAEELMPYDVLGENDYFQIIMDVGQSGIVNSVTYHYDFAD